MTEFDPQTMCGFIVNSPKRGPKPCVLPIGHPTTQKHSTIIRRDYRPLEAEDLASFTIVTKPNERAALAPIVTVGRQAAERSDVLKQHDTWNRDLYTAWVTAGKPEEFGKSPIGKVHTTAEKAETVRFMIRNSADYLNKQEGLSVGIHFGNPNVRDQQGRTVVSWRVIDRRERSTTE